MTWLWEILNKPRLEITMMDELQVFGLALLLIIAIVVAWSVVSSWLEKRKP